MADKGKAALTGAATGAAAGAVLGPWGAAGGAVIGGALGYFGADDTPAPSYTPDAGNFTYGVGDANSYANREATRYAQERESLQGQAWTAQQREAAQQTMPDQRAFAASNGQDYLNGAGAEARQQQIAALGGIQSANNRMSQFANQAEGPSAAQAMLQQSTDSAVAQQNAMARSQPGGGGAAMRNAAFNSAGLQQQANAQASQLRAQESQAHRAQQLQALGALQSGTGMQASQVGQLRGADTGLAQAQAGQANYNSQQQNQYNQFQQGQEFQLGANNLNAQQANQQMQNSYATGLLGMAGQYDDRRNQVAAQNMQAGMNYESAKAQAAGLGSANYNSAADRGLQETGMMLGAMSGAAGAYGQMNAPAASGAPASDIRAKKNIRPAEVATALGGKPGGSRGMTPAEAWAAYDRRAAASTAHNSIDDRTDEFGPRTDVARGTDEFAPAQPVYNPQRPQAPLDSRREWARTLGGQAPAPESYAYSDPSSARAEGALLPVVDRTLRAFGNTPPNDEEIAITAEDLRKAHGDEAADEFLQFAKSSFGPSDELAEADLRGAQPYEYEYKDPARHGEGTYVGPMAQDLEHLPGVVEQDPDGTKTINTPRLTLAQTGAISEQQRRLDRLERMAALGGRPQAMGYGGRY
jgi:hypothetical protein